MEGVTEPPARQTCSSPPSPALASFPGHRQAAPGQCWGGAGNLKARSSHPQRGLPGRGGPFRGRYEKRDPAGTQRPRSHPWARTPQVRLWPLHPHSLTKSPSPCPAAESTSTPGCWLTVHGLAPSLGSRTPGTVREYRGALWKQILQTVERPQIVDTYLTKNSYYSLLGTSSEPGTVPAFHTRHPLECTPPPRCAGTSRCPFSRHGN